MGLTKIKKYKFAYDFYDSRIIYPFYQNILNSTNGESYLNRDNKNVDGLTDTLHIVNYINPYYTIIINEKETPLIALKFQQTSGFLAQLGKFTSVEQYMSAKMSSKSRTKIRGYIRRLETCFPISYKMYFGEISKKDYNFLFSKFNVFLTNRFSQRGDDHEAFPRWDSIQSSTYNMIENKTASLFVIYNGDQPIDICLNYHHQNIIDNAIRSYDIDYSKYRLGYIDIYKQLEWCFENGVEIFDLSIGDFDYKRQWCNVQYEFENHILYDKNSFLKKVIAHVLLAFYKSKGYLKKKNVHLIYHKIRSIFKPKKKSNPSYTETVITCEEMEHLPSQKNITKIDHSLEKYKALRKPIYDFQYGNTELSKHLKVYKTNNQNTIFYVNGLRKTFKIRLVQDNSSNQ